MSLVVAIVASLAFASVASATKYFHSFFGTTSASSTGTPPSPAGTAYGAMFNASTNGGIGDISVNSPVIGADGGAHAGWIYVVDRGLNRIQAFDANKSFQWAIGRDVIAPTVNEHQNLTVAATGGQFRLEFNGQTTGDLAFNATAATVQAALRALSSISGANVNVTGGPGSASGSAPYVIAFVGTLAAANQAQVTTVAGTTPLTGTATAATVADGTAATPGNLGVVAEKCTVAVHCKAGVAGSLGGEFNGAQGIDIDQQTGHLFIRERDPNRRVQELTATGDFVRAWGWDVVQEATSGDTPTDEFETCFVATECKAAGPAGTALGQFGSSTSNGHGIAVAPAGSSVAGDVFVVDPGGSTAAGLANRRILRFEVPTSPSAPVLPVQAFGTSARFGQNANADCDFPRQVAVDSNGVVYATSASTCSSSGPNVERYDTSAGTFLNPLAFSLWRDSGNNGSVNGLDIDQATDHLLVGARPTRGIVEFDLTSKPLSVTASDIVGSHGVGLNVAVNGLGVNPATGEYFVSTTSSSSTAGLGAGARVLVLDDDGVDPPPSVVPLPPTDVGATEATLNASINPNGPTGFPTAYRFQLSKDGISWTDVGSDQPVGDGGVAVLKDDVVTGLEANTFYRVRVVTTRSPAAGVTVSPELTFLTDADDVRAETVTAQQVSDTGAQLVGRVNPGGLAASYWFEWGDDSYGNTIPVPAGSAGSGSVIEVVGERLTGLDPDTVYHFRVCAQNALSSVCGSDSEFTTREIVEAPEGRAFEMVTAPDKPLRNGGSGVGGADVLDFARATPPLPSADDSTVRWTLFPGATSGEAGHAFTWAETHEDYSRTTTGWKPQSVTNIPPLYGASGAFLVGRGTSADLEVSAWDSQAAFFDNFPAENYGSALTLRVKGDTGGPRGAGWYPWIDPSWFAGTSGPQTIWLTRIDDQGRRLIGWGLNGGREFHAVTPADGGAAPEDLDPPQTSGLSLFRSGPAVDWRPGDLVNECTGAGGGATGIPTRDDKGTIVGPSTASGSVTVTAGSDSVTVHTMFLGSYGVGQLLSNAVGTVGQNFPAGTIIEAAAAGTITVSAEATATATGTLVANPRPSEANDDTVIARPCEEGSPTDVRGARLGGGSTLNASSITAMSDSGNRVFFASPDPALASDQGSAVGQSIRTCSDAAGAATACPPQLFVRSYDGAGGANVRWISRAEDALFGGPSGLQHPNTMGRGVAFEGASRDGSVVYFRTNAPLLENDPNGGDDPLVKASPISWDLYRYELGDESDPAPAGEDPGDRLTRVTAGPDPDGAPADPNTNCTSSAALCGDGANGSGTAVRFMSDDGSRVYMVTASPIAGASNARPAGGSTDPGGTATNSATRNLYLYDADKTGPAAYEFIARIPFAISDGTVRGDVDACASHSETATGATFLVSPASNELGLLLGGAACVHGTTSGDAIVFQTRGQLTADDVDSAVDIYLYEVGPDRLTRVSAPPTGSSPYVCQRITPASPVLARCNGDFGITNGNSSLSEAGQDTIGSAGQRHWNIAENPDGSLKAVYFESRLALSPDDVNGSGAVGDTGGEGVMDVYEWRNGQVSLISPGSSPDSAFYSGNGLDGRRVFFWTEQRISPWEIDPSDGDLYTAAVGDGLPGPVAPAPVCAVLGGGCHAGGFDSVSSDTKTQSSSESGNAKAETRKSLSLRKPSASQRRKAARSGVISLRIRSNKAGRVSAVARGRVGKKMRRVGRASKRLSKPGVTTVRIRLNRVALKQLRRGRKLTLSVVVRSPGARPRSVKVPLRRAGR
jgi:hypothetical protein